MNPTPLNRAYPDVEPGFERSVERALEAIRKEKKMKRKITPALLIAAVLTLSLVGAGIAAGRLGVFRALRGLTPLDGAEQLVSTDLAATENEYARLSVEQAVYDGSGALLQLRLTPRDPEAFAFAGDTFPESEYLFEEAPMPADGWFDEYEGDPTYEVGGIRYYRDHTIPVVSGRVDGRKPLRGTITVSALTPDFDSATNMSSLDVEPCADGSAVYWISMQSAAALPDALELEIAAEISPIGRVADMPRVRFGPLRLTLTRSADARRATLVPVDSTQPMFSAEPCTLTLTPLRGYLRLDLACPVSRDDSDGEVALRLYDGDGNEIPVDANGLWYGPLDNSDGLTRVSGLITFQALDALPDTLTLDVRTGNARSEIRFRVEEEG